MSDPIELQRPLPGYVLLTTQAEIDKAVAGGHQLYVYRRPRWGDMWFVKERNSEKQNIEN